MSNEIPTIKADDTAHEFVSTLVKTDSQEEWTLDGATVEFLLKKGADYYIADAEIVSVPDKIVRYEQIDGFPTDPGKYSQEWRVTFPSGKVLTFPNGKYNHFNIKRNLAAESS